MQPASSIAFHACCSNRRNCGSISCASFVVSRKKCRSNRSLPSIVCCIGT
ncbi:hypothetical protein X948_5162 [Burkholderia pseudomallei MSHR5608]|nr:hypothetical protein X948_5162 [Burkholderia pseudomallei MSHR5608]